MGNSATMRAGVAGLGAMSQMGQKAKYSLRVDVFRFSLETGHRPMGSACPIRAKGLNRFAIVVAAGGAANRVLGCERPFLRIEGFSTSPKTGASHDQRDDEPVTPAHDRRHDDPQFRAEDPPRLYPQRQEPDCVSRPLA